MKYTALKKKKKLKKYNVGGVPATGAEGMMSPELLSMLGGGGGGALAAPTALAGTLLDSTTQLDPEYKSTLKDENQLIGQGAGLAVAGVGQAFGIPMNLTAPLLMKGGAAVQRGFQKEKVDKAKFAGQTKEMEEMMKRRTQAVLSNYASQGIEGANNYAFGGKPKAEYEAEQGEVIEGTDTFIEGSQLASNLREVEGDSHEEGGTPGAGGDFIYSDRLISKSGKTFAQEAKTLGKAKGKMEKLNPDKITNNSLKRVEARLANLKQEQEAMKRYIQPRKYKYADGGNTPKKNATLQYLTDYGIVDAKDPHTIKDMERYRKIIQNEIQVVDPSTSEKVSYAELLKRSQNPKFSESVKHPTLRGRKAVESYLQQEFDKGKEQFWSRANSPEFQSANIINKSVTDQLGMTEKEFQTVTNPISLDLAVSNIEDRRKKKLNSITAKKGSRAEQLVRNENTSIFKPSYRLGGKLPKYAYGEDLALMQPMGATNIPNDTMGGGDFTQAISAMGNLGGQAAGAAGFNYAALIPYASNLVNAFITSKRPKVPKPTYDSPLMLKKDYNINPQLQEIRASERSLYKNIDESTSNASIGRSNKLAGFAKTLEEKNRLYGTKANMEMDLANKEITANKDIEINNNRLADAYNMAKMKRTASMQNEVSQNVSDISSKYQMQQRDNKLFNLEDRKLALIAAQDGDRGTLERLAKKGGFATVEQFLQYLNKR